MHIDTLNNFNNGNTVLRLTISECRYMGNFIFLNFIALWIVFKK